MFCLRAAEAVVADPGSLGVVIGGSGNGEQIAANKVKGVRAALVWSEETAVLARQHNDANVISVGGRMHTVDEMTHFVDLFLATAFTGEERHVRRIAMLSDYEQTGDLPPLPAAAPSRPTRSGPCLRVTPCTGSPPRSPTPSPAARCGSAARRAGSTIEAASSTAPRCWSPSRPASTCSSTSTPTGSSTSTWG